MKKTRYQLFAENLVQDAGLFIFFLVLLSVYRIGFLAEFRQLLAPDTTGSDIWLTLWYGVRLSLKTSGAVVLVPFVLGTVVQSIFTRWPAKKIRLCWGIFACLVFALLFQARIPYYKEFQSAFGPFVFNTFHDDVYAIVKTAIDQYNAVWRVVMGLICAAVTGGMLAGWMKWIRPAGEKLAHIKHPARVVIGFCVCLVPLFIFIRFGGSFGYKHSIYWKNSARMSQHLLNEAILDDVQALYKASRLLKQMRKFSHSVSVEDVRAAASRITGKPLEENSILPALTHQAKGAKIERPRHIFVIVAETYMLWPLLDEYKELPIAKGVRSLLARKDALLVPHFLSASGGTMFGLTSVVLGLPELNLFAANRPTAKEPYETALSVQLKKLGYTARFFYGGFPSWEDVGAFMQNQSFDESFYYADFGGKGGVWGVHDKILFEGIEEKITDAPSLNVILTSTNHPPYTVDMRAEPTITSAEEMRKFVPDSVPDKEATVERMQHFEYADKYLTEFVEKMLQKYPDSLFVITGDHADRWTLTANPSLYERLAVPFILVGKGISKDLLPARPSGAHQDIVPTVMELILPKGATYFATGKDVLAGEQTGLHAYYFITPDVIGELGGEKVEVLPAAQMPSAEELDKVRADLQDVQTLSVWRVLNGTSLEK